MIDISMLHNPNPHDVMIGLDRGNSPYLQILQDLVQDDCIHPLDNMRVSPLHKAKMTHKYK